MRKPRLTLADTSDFTKADWQQLKLCGVLVKGDRIIRTLAFIKKSEAGARKHIKSTARRLFRA